MNLKSQKARVIAYYLPQYHPIKENNEWWGTGFTEWNNVVNAKPLFKGHYQPKFPSDLGFYDLRLSEVREKQAELARMAGIEGFCYWHYWLGEGKELLERPFNEVLQSGKPDFPFCLGWANHSWTNKTWEKKSEFKSPKVLIEQTYSENDYVEHFYNVLKAFKDNRYITVDSKPLFLIFRPLDLPDPKHFVDLWTNLAIQNGLKGIYFVGLEWDFTLRDLIRGNYHFNPEISSKFKTILDSGFSAINSRREIRAEFLVKGIKNRILLKFFRKILRTSYIETFDQKLINQFLFTDEDKNENIFPTLIPNWDRTPRAGKFATIYTHSTPQVFKNQILSALELVKNKQPEHKIIFLKSWNEWGEGNYVEPDIKYQHGYLDALKSSLY